LTKRKCSSYCQVGFKGILRQKKNYENSRPKCDPSLVLLETSNESSTYVPLGYLILIAEEKRNTENKGIPELPF
jgi:hypothetical protein